MEPLIDSHCHLTFDGLRERSAEVIARAKAVGVEAFVTVATDLADAERALVLSAEHGSVHVAAGVHPHEADKVVTGWDAVLERTCKRGDVVAVGETGLDYHYDLSDRESQKRVFRRQLEIATEVGKPVIIHCRQAQADAMAILADFDDLPGVVFHCFTGSEAEAADILDRGYWMSLTGVVTFKRSDELRRVARMIPEDHLMIETDSPYLSPEPVRKVRPNEPAHLPYTAACVAFERGLSVSALSAMTVRNTCRFFSLPSL